MISGILFAWVLYVMEEAKLERRPIWKVIFQPYQPWDGARQDAFSIYFEWNDKFGFPGAFYIQNFIKTDEFFLVSVTLEDIPNHGTIHFVCNSWVYNFRKCKKDRIFFVNHVSSAPTYSVVSKLFKVLC